MKSKEPKVYDKSEERKKLKQAMSQSFRKSKLDSPRSSRVGETTFLKSEDVVPNLPISAEKKPPSETLSASKDDYSEDFDSMSVSRRLGESRNLGTSGVGPKTKIDESIKEEPEEDSP